MKIALTLALSGTILLNASLVDEAKKAGLKPIPDETSELLKLIDNPKNPITDAKVELGKKLYFDPRLSKSQIVSCNSCHNLAEGGDDGVEASIGHKWAANPHHLNAPTVYNAVFFEKQFWDGRSQHLEAQAQGPVQALPEMAATPKYVEEVVNSIPAYVDEFESAYGKGVDISFEKVTDTIAVFERTLVTPSRYDAFLNGDSDALSLKEKKGLETFIEVGCASCHNDVALGGNMNVMNVMAEYKYQNVGDFKGDANGMVKVPTLRNITQTAPYFHNGKIWSLKDAIDEMARVQLGISISKEQVNSIESFLQALDGEKKPLIYPMLPASTDKTPKPDIN
jgi:cytochrome c peroxidase